MIAILLEWRKEYLSGLLQSHSEHSMTYSLTEVFNQCKMLLPNIHLQLF